MTNTQSGVRIERIDDILDYTDAFGYLQTFYGGEDRTFQESSTKTFATGRLRQLRLGHCAYTR